jgi:hypothetical protein
MPQLGGTVTKWSWFGIAFAIADFALFGFYISKHEITAASGFVFGGGLLFAGMLIDPTEFKSVLGFLPFSKRAE